MSIPPVIFYVFLAKSLTGIPFADDYDTVLRFLLQWRTEGWIKHLAQVVTFQHNDYRCMFENGVVGIQYALLGRADLKMLSMLGDLLVIPLFGVLYLIWIECGRPHEYTFLAFVPVSWLLFQLQYEGTLNYATSGLQCIPVILFALLTCLLATKASRMAFLGTLVSFMLCVASYANGLFLIPIGALIYLQRKEYRRLTAWCCVGVIACLIYFHKYDFTVEASNTHMSNNVSGILQHLSPVYAAAFLGSIATIRTPWPAILLGFLLTATFFFVSFNRLFSRRPALYYSMMFFFVTGLAVSGLRSGFGITQALDSRYRINSTVLLILLYLYLADRFYGVLTRRWILKSIACTAALLLMGFNIASNYTGAKFLEARRNALEAEMTRWEQHGPRHQSGTLFPSANTAENERFKLHWDSGLYDPIEPFLTDAIREGIFTLPLLPTESQSRLNPSHTTTPQPPLGSDFLSGKSARSAHESFAPPTTRDKACSALVFSNVS